ncbi:unnamed protein product [Ambrosiozyma monospora]|uniref:Unnamed protein product n=1 Tax=Ambrosiozyma monospora TaxID=43982 RepID=A0ACB5U4U0_AMBMO|nr:unnamed protein product [Ambrosiozyma monospora]
MILNVPTSDNRPNSANANYNNNNEVSNQITFSNSLSLKTHPNKVKIYDPDFYRSELAEDPIEYKYRRLERVHQVSPLDKDIRPTLKIRGQLNSILQKQFFEKLSPKEKNLIWKFRFYLLNTLILSKNTFQFNNFLINFIKCIDWDDDFEVGEFLTIINNLDSNGPSRNGGLIGTEIQTETRTGSTTSAIDKFASMGSNVFVQELQIVDCLELLSENYQ